MRACAALLLLALLTTAGCGVASTPPASACPAPATITNADNGHTLCAPVGAQITVLLTGTAASRWLNPATDSDALKPTTDPQAMVTSGDTVARFTAAHQGTAHLTSSRPVCPSQPGKLSCQSLEAFSVTVQVR